MKLTNSLHTRPLPFSNYTLLFFPSCLSLQLSLSLRDPGCSPRANLFSSSRDFVNYCCFFMDASCCAVPVLAASPFSAPLLAGISTPFISTLTCSFLFLYRWHALSTVIYSTGILDIVYGHFWEVVLFSFALFMIWTCRIHPIGHGPRRRRYTCHSSCQFFANTVIQYALLTEILKKAGIPSSCLVRMISELRISPSWGDIPLPQGITSLADIHSISPRQ